ncbi:helix-turn-helix domain-containing protein [Paenibacillus paridis]|uniref:helix-turn-helix domain-containing protein n=1 Tax=Paenibacillus paridis TaxID=2583376 RepID=UPI00111E67C0|nr:helix-turn-helix domain-containing protein [Paenibacillus paridis]
MPATEKKSSMGVLQLREGEKKFQLDRYPPSEQLRPFVKHYWVITWNLENEPPYFQDVVPNPCVNLVMEDNKSGIYGVASRMYTQKIEGKGRVFGVKFQPGGFYPYIQSPLSKFTDQASSLESVFGMASTAYMKQIAAHPDTTDRIALTEALLLQHLPPVDLTASLVNQIIARIQEDRELTTVEQLCGEFRLNKRKLQRLFSQYVGISPKWVIKLYRLQNAAEAMDNSSPTDLLKLALELGYYDQSHFSKDFKSIIGKTPEEYARP